MQEGDVVVTFHRQNQVRQLEDTWPMDGLCIYKYQLATQVDRRQVHRSRKFGQILIVSSACDYLNAQKSDMHTPMRCIPIKYTPVGYTSIGCTPGRCTS